MLTERIEYVLLAVVVALKVEAVRAKEPPRLRLFPTVRPPKNEPSRAERLLRSESVPASMPPASSC